MPSAAMTMTDWRGHWECVTCGVGVCVQSGQLPLTPEHILHDGRVCGEYELIEEHIDCDKTGVA